MCKKMFSVEEINKCVKGGGFDPSQRIPNQHVLPVLLADFYKTAHREQYPEGTEVIFSNWIPRTSRIDGINKVVSFGQQRYVLEILVDYFNEHFFNRNKEDVIAEYERFMTCTMGKQCASSQHIADLHDLGYFPIEIRSIEEGLSVPIRVPMLTMINTSKKFFWATNYLETVTSSEIWQPMTDATLSKSYREILDAYAMETVGSTEGVQFQGHDFSMRGMSGWNAAANSSMGHLLSFVGTDTMPAIAKFEYFYYTNIENYLVGCSVPATEHSVQCVNGVKTIIEEIAFAKRLITEIYPEGIVSMVSDTINLWEVLLTLLPAIKDEVMGRDGKLVIRPDSGDPVKIICGDPEANTWYERKGVVELLWDEFGGTTSDEGYKVLDSHIGAIYGDSITIDRCVQICEKLKQKGFASVNIVLGIGSFTYQYNTRDTFGFAMKTTFAVVDGEEKAVKKDPITDNGTKKSLEGLCVVVKDASGEFVVIDKLTMDEYIMLRDWDYMQTIYKDGMLYNQINLEKIRSNVSA